MPVWDPTFHEDFGRLEWHHHSNDSCWECRTARQDLFCYAQTKSILHLFLRGPFSAVPTPIAETEVTQYNALTDISKIQFLTFLFTFKTLICNVCSSKFPAPKPVGIDRPDTRWRGKQLSLFYLFSNCWLIFGKL